MQIIKPNTKFDFVNRIKLFGSLSVGLVLLSLVGIATRGFNWGIDFAGGTELQVRFDQDVATADLRQALVDMGFEKNQVQDYGAPSDHEYLLRVERITSLSEARVARLREEAIAHFGADRLHSVVFEANQGDRLAMDFSLQIPEDAPKPAPVAADVDGGSQDGSSQDGSAGVSEPAPVDKEEQALKDQAAKEDNAVTALKQEVEDFFATAKVELRPNESVTASAVRDSRVELIVHFKGVSGRVVKTLTQKFGLACTDANAKQVCTNTKTCMSGHCRVDNRRTDYVDSTVSKELRTDGLLAIIYALIGILIYIAVRFDFYFSPGAVVALMHDVIITMGIFAWTGLEFDLTVVAALLTIVGYSLNDTIVVYDRIRETLPSEDKLKEQDRGTYVNTAINDTLSRTLLTSITTMLVIIALLFFATGVIKTFGIALLIGVTIGTYSSVFVASPVYLTLKKVLPGSER